MEKEKSKKKGTTQTIRNLDASVLMKIDDMARKRNVSREQYLRELIINHSLAGEITEIEDKYSSLIKLLAEKFESTNEIIEKNTYILEKMMERI